MLDSNHDVPIRAIDVKSTKFLLDLFKQKSSRSSEKFNMNHRNGVMAPPSIPRLKPVHRQRIP